MGSKSNNMSRMGHFIRLCVSYRRIGYVITPSSSMNICIIADLSSVCLRLSQFFQLSFIQYMGLCVFSLPIYLMMIVRIRVLYLIIIIKSAVSPLCHCLGLGNETKVCFSAFLSWYCGWEYTYVCHFILLLSKTPKSYHNEHMPKYYDVTIMTYSTRSELFSNYLT